MRREKLTSNDVLAVINEAPDGNVNSVTIPSKQAPTEAPQHHVAHPARCSRRTGNGWRIFLHSPAT